MIDKAFQENSALGMFQFLKREYLVLCELATEQLQKILRAALAFRTYELQKIWC